VALGDAAVSEGATVELEWAETSGRPGRGSCSNVQHGALACAIGQVEALGHNAVDRGVSASKPLFGDAQIAREWGEGQPDRAIRLREEAVQGLAAISEWHRKERAA
jgi:hypothetical protein